MVRTWLVTSLLLVLMACSPAGQSRPAADFSPPPQAKTVAGATVGTQAPVFTIPTLGGGTFDLAQQRGRVVGMFFMAVWCGTCLPEAKAWATLSREFGARGLAVLIVSADPGDTESELAHFRDASGGGELAWALDPVAAIVRPYAVTALDTTVIIGRDGQVVYRDAVPTRYEQLKQALEKLL